MAEFPSVMPAPRTLDPKDAPPLRWGVMSRGGSQSASSDRCSATPGSRWWRWPRAISQGPPSSPPGTASRARSGHIRNWSTTPTSTSSTSPPPTTRTTPVLCCRCGPVSTALGREAPRAERQSRLHGTGRNLAAPGRFPHGSTLDDVSAEVRRDPAVAGNWHAGRDQDGAWPTMASTSPTITGSCGPTWPVGRCWISAPTRSRSLPGSWVSRPAIPGLRPTTSGRGERPGVGDPGQQRGQSGRSINTTIFSTTPTTGVIAGTAATLTIPGPYYQPGDMTLTSNTGQVLTCLGTADFP